MEVNMTGFRMVAASARSLLLLIPARAAVAVILFALSGHGAWSQPTRTIKIIVPYPAGGPTDTVARLLADQIGHTQGPTMVVENRPGRAA